MENVNVQFSPSGAVQNAESLLNCSICSIKFIRDVVRKWKLPLTLSCCHAVCLRCVQDRVKRNLPLTCTICKVTSKAPESSAEFDIYKHFPPNFYLAGLCSSYRFTTYDEPVLNFVKKPYKVQYDANKRSVSCDECDVRQAELTCPRCPAVYCAHCFQKTHSAVKALKDHAAKPLVSLAVNGSDDGLTIKCDLHCESNLEFHCDVCNEVICSQCLIETHNGHSMNSLTDKNKELEDSVMDAFVSLNNHLNRLKASLKAAKESSSHRSPKGGATRAEKIRIHFFLLHSRLALIESQVLKELKDAEEVDPSLDAVIQDLNSSIEAVQTGIVRAKSVIIQKQYQNVNYVKLIEYMKDLMEYPCYFMKGDYKTEVDIDDSVLSVLDEHVTVKVSGEKEYRLCAKDELPSNFIPEEAPVTSGEELRAVLFDGIVLSSSDKDEDDRSSQRSSNSSVSFKEIIQNSLEDDLVPGVVVEGRVTHINSPSEFYFHRITAKEKLDQLNRDLQYFIKSGKTRELMPKEIRVGSIYVRQYSDLSWCRCKVLKFRNGRVTISYLDFGNCEKLNPFGTIPDRIKNLPPLALKCKLTDCFPTRGQDWSPEAVDTFVQIVTLGKDIQFHVVKKKDSCYEVDVLVPEDNGCTQNIRDALIFLDHATYLSNRKRIETPGLRPKQLPAQETLVTPCDVVLLSVVSLDEIYVEPKTTTSDLCKAMLDDMTKTYTLNRNHNVNCYDPRPGAMVAVQSETDKNWLRALIVEPKSKSEIVVFCVDRGQHFTLSWERLFTLEARYYYYPAMAYKFKLADVAPAVGQTWPLSAISYVQKFAMKTLIMSATSDDGGECPGIQLTYASQFSKICLNASLVLDCDDVVSTRNLSSQADFRRDTTRFPILSTNEFCSSGDVASLNLETRDVEPRSRTSSMASNGGNALSRKFVVPEFTSPVRASPLPMLVVEDTRVIRGDDGVTRIQVEMQRIVSPAEFYVIIVKEKNKIEGLVQALNQHYRDSTPDENVDWSNHVFCVVNSGGKWYRGMINDVDEEDQSASVYLPDEGISVTVPLVNLRKLDVKFAEMRDAVTRCSLAGLIPQSGPNYALTATTELEEFVDNFKNELYIANYQPDGGDKGLRVELLGKTRKPAGPFDAASDVWSSFNYKLWKVGFARAESFIRWSAQETLVYVGDRSNAPKTEEEILMEHFASSFMKTPDGKIDLLSPIPPGSKITPLRWPPPEPFPKLSFVGKPTYITDNLVVYVQDTRHCNIHLARISEQLTKYCESTSPSVYDCYNENEICAARYHLDDKWYRGCITRVDETNNLYVVEFVDYGNIEYLTRDEIRKVDLFLDIPIQVRKCYFTTLHPVGKNWNQDDIKELHKLIVDVQCNVEVSILPDGRYEINRMILPNGMSVQQEIVSRRWGCYENHEVLKNPVSTKCPPSDKNESGESDVEVIVEPETHDSSKSGFFLWASYLNQVKSHRVLFEVLPIPEEVDSLIVEITAVLSPTVVIAKLLESDNRDLDDNLRLFQAVQSSLQMSAPNFPVVSPPYFMKECCAKFSDDKMWYRAIVIRDEDSSGQVLIQYVDYGNVELVDKNDIRELTETMRLICAQGIPCRLDGFTYVVRNPGAEVMSRLHEHLGDKRLRVKIKERGSIMTVDLTNLDGSSVYGPLVEDGILKAEFVI